MDLVQAYDLFPTERYCSGCNACAIRCSGDVPATEDEWQRIMEHLRDEVAPADVRRVLTESKRFEVSRGYHVELCPLYDMNARGCSVYPARPLVCRMLGFVEWMPCPIERPLPVVEGAVELMRAYAQLRPRPIPKWMAETPLPTLTYTSASKRSEVA